MGVEYECKDRISIITIDGRTEFSAGTILPERPEVDEDEDGSEADETFPGAPPAPEPPSA